MAANIWAMADVNSAVVGTLKMGDAVSVVGTSGDFYVIRFRTDQGEAKGYVLKDALMLKNLFLS